MALEGIKAFAFDAYGTLFDYASAASKCRHALGERFERFSELWRDKQLQYTWLRGLTGEHADFLKVTGDALDFALDTFGIEDQRLRARLMDLYFRLDPFPDARSTLERLKAAGFRTAILSNGSPRMLDALIEHTHMTPLLDAVLSVEQAGVFKPHPKVYQLTVDHFGLEKRAISFLTSNAWDAYGASAFGMHVVWCNRYKQRPERLPKQPDLEVPSLLELPALVGA